MRIERLEKEKYYGIQATRTHGQSHFFLFCCCRSNRSIFKGMGKEHDSAVLIPHTAITRRLRILQPEKKTLLEVSNFKVGAVWSIINIGTPRAMKSERCEHTPLKNGPPGMIFQRIRRLFSTKYGPPGMIFQRIWRLLREGNCRS